jgi:diguanylate cyclase
MGTVGVLGILPFAIYRFARGQLLAGFIETGIMLSIATASVYAWRSGKTRVAAWLITIVTLSGCVAIAMILGRPGLLWMYAAMLANFLMLRHSEAALTSLAALAAVAVHGGAFSSTFEMAMFLVTALVVVLFAFIFAYRAEQMRGQLQLLAARDPLTGAANRRSMEEEIPLAIEAARRHGTPCGLALIDLDHFKRINDRHGHAAGDQCLVEFVKLLRTATRKGDRLFRYGGEEFLLLLPGADAAALQVVLGNLRLRIRDGLRCSGEAITASMGGAEWERDETPESWLHRADVALYEAKHSGRDRVIVAASPLAARDALAADELADLG